MTSTKNHEGRLNDADGAAMQRRGLLDLSQSRHLFGNWALEGKAEVAEEDSEEGYPQDPKDGVRELILSGDKEGTVKDRADVIENGNGQIIYP